MEDQLLDGEKERVGEGETGGDGETGRVGDGETQNPELRTQHPELSPDLRPQTPDPLVERLRAELEEARAHGLEAHRRALLAENAGRVVPELVAGRTAEELEASVEVARRAFETAREAALAGVRAASIPAGNPVRQTAGVEGMSPLEKIAYGLRRASE